MVRIVVLLFCFPLIMGFAPADPSAEATQLVAAELNSRESVSTDAVRLAIVERSEKLEEVRRATEDLAAQKEMADAARRMLDLTILQIFIGVLGAVGLFATIALTRKSLQQTRDSLTTDTEYRRAELRAYVGELRVRVDDWEVGQAPVIVVELKNFGQTPAVNVVMASRYRKTNTPPFGEIVPIEEPTRSAKIPDMPPGKDWRITFTLPILTEDERADYVTQERCINYNILVTFDDVFGDSFEFRMSSILTGDHLKRRWFNVPRAVR